MADRASNRERLIDISRRIELISNKLATVAAEAGPLFREAAAIGDELRELLAQARDADATEPAESSGDEPAEED